MSLRRSLVSLTAMIALSFCSMSRLVDSPGLRATVKGVATEAIA